MGRNVIRSIRTGPGVLALLIGGMMAFGPAAGNARPAINFLAGDVTATMASSATPVALPVLSGPFPPGVEVRLLGTASPDGPLPNSAILRLERIRIEAGTDLTAIGDDGALLIVIEQGELAITEADGGLTTIGVGSRLTPEFGARTKVRAGSSGSTQMLVVRLLADGRDGTPTTGRATPGLDPGTRTVTRLLLEAPVRPPREESRIILAEVVWQPGATTAERAYAGPIGLVIETGGVTAIGPDGTPVRLAAGGGVTAPAYTAHEVRNDGGTVASALVVAFLPVDAARAGGLLPPPTPDVAATAAVVASAAAATIAELAADRAASMATSSALLVDLRGARATNTAVAADNGTAATVVAASGDALSSLAANATREAEITNETLSRLEEDRRLAQTAALALATAQSGLGAALEDARLQASAVAATLATREAEFATAEAAAVAPATIIADLEQSAVDLARTTESQLTSLSATAAANSIRADNAEATAVGARMAMATSATAVALSNDLGKATATAQAVVLADLAALATAASGISEESIATVVAASTVAAATAAAEQASLTAAFVEVEVDGDLDGVLSGDPTSEAALVDTLRRRLARYQRSDCRAGVVLTFGHADDVGTGVEYAAAVNGLIRDQFGSLFDATAFDAFADLTPPAGSVQLRIYFFGRCEASSSSMEPTATTSVPTIVPRA